MCFSVERIIFLFAHSFAVTLLISHRSAISIILKGLFDRVQARSSNTVIVVVVVVVCRRRRHHHIHFSGGRLRREYVLFSMSHLIP